MKHWKHIKSINSIQVHGCSVHCISSEKLLCESHKYLKSSALLSLKYINFNSYLQPYLFNTDEV